MTCNNVILAQPEAGTSVNYEMPATESAKLSFGPEDISGLNINAEGGLVINFVKGGSLTITNFSEMASNDNMLFLSDGTMVDPKLLQAGLSRSLTQAGAADNDVIIGKPSDGVINEITLEPGKDYIFGFTMTEPSKSYMKDGKFVMSFDNGGEIVLANYQEAMAGDNAPTLSMDTKVCELKNADLVAALAGETTPIASVEPAAGEEEKVAHVAHKAVKHVADIEPGAGDTAQKLAQVEPAAGDPGKVGNTGYGFGSSPNDDTLGSPNAIGPLGVTALKYVAPSFEQNSILTVASPAPTPTPVNNTPAVSPARNTLDETNLGPLVGTGKVVVDFGADGPGTIKPNGDYDVGGSVKGGSLASCGVPVVITETPTGYKGMAGAETVFTLVIDPNTGDYTYTQYKPFDHADATNPDDAITLTFGVVATDGDDDSTDTQITITVKDDGPIANDDTASASEGQTITGNVVTPNDVLSKDGNNVVAKVSFNGVEHTVPTTGFVTVVGQYGTLKLYANGDYSYKANSNNPSGTDVFTYTLCDCDQDVDTAQLRITVTSEDDRPILIQPETWTIDETNLGPINLNGDLNADFGADAPGHFAGTGTFTSTGSKTGGNLTHNGVPVVVSFDSGTGLYTGKAGTVTVFTLKVDANGDYHFSLLENLDHADGTNPNDIIELNFGVKAVDSDGDETTGVINIKVKDDVPTITTDFTQVDETNLTAGPLVVTDTIPHDFGEDGPGDIKPNGDFIAKFEMDGPSVTLTSGGQPIVVTQTANGYVGKVGTTTIFDISVNPATGQYTFHQYDNIDHPGTSDPDDVIWLKFGVTIKDWDGDTDTAYIGIDVHDDGPVANDDGQTHLDENQTVTGNVTTNDKMSTDAPNVVSKVSFNGTDYTVPSVGQVTVTGVYGVLKIDATGAYSYTAKDNANGTDAFTYTLKDKDGDTDTAIISFCVTGQDDQPVIVNGYNTVDETGGFDTVSGTVSVNYGADGPGTVTGTNVFSSTYPITSNGTPVVVTYNAGTHTYTGTAGGQSVFTLVVNTDGTYTFQQLKQIDHANASDPNDSVDLVFGVKATDADGDVGTGNITIRVYDDGPVANDDGQTHLDENQTVTGNVTTNDTMSKDVPNVVSKVSFNGTDYTVPSVGQVTVTGVYGVLKIDATGAYSYTAKDNANGTDAFTYTLKDKDGDTDTAIISFCVTGQDDQPVIVNGYNTVDETGGFDTVSGTVSVNYGADGPGTVTGTNVFSSTYPITSNGTPVSVTYNAGTHTYTGTAGGQSVFTLLVNTDGTYTFQQLKQIDHANASDPNDSVDLVFGVKATDADGDVGTGNITIRVYDDGPVANDDGQTHLDENQTVTGNVTTNDTMSKDVPNVVSKVSFNGTDYTVPSVGQVTVTGVYGVLKIDATGAYSYTAKDNANGTDAFTYTLKDKDGDTDTAIISFCVTGQDDQPVIVNGYNTVDETGGFDTVSGTVSVNYGADGPGTVTGTNVFSSTYPITSNGTPVVVTYNAGTHTYTGTAGGQSVFTLVVNTDGTYTFQQLKQIDHANASDPNDSVDLVFGVKATDADGDVGTGNITIRVYDDGPVANDDGQTHLDENQIVTGNVTTNDTMSKDEPNTVSKVSFNGTDYTVPSVGQVTVTGVYGVLKIDATGAYSYTAKDNADGTDAFTYTLKDKDGDTDTAIISFCVTGQDDQPVIVNGYNTVDETGGFDTVSGTVSVNYGADGPGTVTGTNVFSSTYPITSNGTPVVVTYNAGTHTYTGTAGGQSVFTLVVNTDGTYTFQQLKQIDHANASDPNDSVDLVFGVKATDADGDVGTGNITIRVYDDAPLAADDLFCVTSGCPDFTPTVVDGFNSVDETAGFDTVSGAVSVDFHGQGPGTVTGTNVFSSTYPITSNGTPVVVTYNAGTHTYTGTAGGQSVFTLVVNTDGTYTFQQLKQIDHADSSDPDDTVDLTFGIKATDVDGDTANGNIVIRVYDDGPVAIDDNGGNVAAGGSTSGNVLTNDIVGADVDGRVIVINHNGTDVTVPSGSSATITGTNGVLHIFGNGSYTYTANGAGNGTDAFTYTLRDKDGDTDPAILSFCVKPADPDHNPVVAHAFNQVDETGGFDTVSGTVSVNYNGDGPGTVTGANTFSSSYALKSCGVPVVVTYNATTGIYTGKAGATTVFTMDINANGTYTFKQYDQLDHALKGLNGVNHNDALDLVFGVKATDADGDVGTGTATIRVLDDGPIARDDAKTILESSMNRTWVKVGVLANDTIGADNGAGAQIIKAVFSNGSTSIKVGTATYDVRVSADGKAVEVKSSGGDQNRVDNKLTIIYTVKDCDGDTDTAKLVITQNDNFSPLVLDLDGDGIELVDTDHGVFFDLAADGGVMDRTAWAGKDDGLLAVDTDGDGRITDRTELFGDTGGFADGFAKLSSYDTNGDGKIDASDAHFGDLIVWKDVNTDGVSQAAEMFKLSNLGITSINVLNTDVPDYLINGQDITHESTFTMNGQTRTIVDAWFQSENGDVLAGPGADPNLNGLSQSNVIKASVLHNDTFSADQPSTISAVIFGGTTYAVPANGTVTINGLYGTLVMGSDGKFTYTAKDGLTTQQMETFQYRLVDKDGDATVADLRLCVEPSACSVDDRPVVVDGANAVDETGGFDTVSGTVTVNYGGDGPGTVTGTNVFTSSYALKSCGVPVVVTYNATTGIYTGMAGARTVFTMDIDANGAYTFKQLDQLDHANVSDPNDAVNLVFGVKATDADGDVGTGNITITVRDDGPVANDDNGGDVNAGATKIGNVLTNDVVGADADGRVIIVNFNGTSVTIPSTSTGTVINGTNGVLTMKGDGSYSYVAKAAGNGVDNFTYTLKDCDGDTDPAILSFCVKPIVLDPPVVTVNNGVNDVCVKEDGQVTVPVRASYAGGDGDEVMTLTLKGATVAGWTVTAPGWTKVGADWVITLPAGQKSYAGNVTFKPPANKDTDIPNLSVEAKLYDPDTAKTATSTDTFRVITDAVADGSNLTVPGSAVYVQKPDLSSAVTTTGAWGLTYTTYTKYITTKVADGSIYLRYGVDTSPLSLGISLNDKDGSEAVTKIVLTYRPDVTGQEMTFNKGTKIALNKWEIPVANGDVATALKNLTLKVDQDTRTSEKVFNSGKLSVAVYSQEKNLSGAECNLADNTHVETKVIDFYARYSPLALDMDRDGVELVSIHNGVQFDMNNDGDKENVGWVAKDDALLAIDLNRDGVINNQSELFGNTDTLDNGFANLAQYDSNEDGVIDVKDAAFKDLIVWQDADTDGVSDAGEMVTLDQAGITSISLDAQGADREVEGNWISHESTFTRADGSTGEIVDAWFAVGEGTTAGSAEAVKNIVSVMGQDMVAGTEGADRFVFDVIAGAATTLQGFNAAEGDQIDLSALLEGHDDVTDAINQFVYATEQGGDTVISVDISGSGNAANAVEVARLEATTGVDVAELVKNGELIV